MFQVLKQAEQAPISISLILFLGVLASFIALSMRMRWEEVLAFIAAPFILLAILTSANQGLKSGPSAEAARQASAPPLAPPQNLGAEEPSNLLAIILPLAFLLIVAAVFTKRRSIAFELNAYLKRMATNKPRSGKARTRSAKQAAAHGAIYYETAIRLGALIAAAEGHPPPQALVALKRVFNLSEDIFPNTDTLFEDALDHPRKMSKIIEPFLAEYGLKSSSSETLIFGMSSVAMSNGAISERALGLIRMTGDALGLLPGATSRLLMSAGYFGGRGRSNRQQSQSSYRQAQSSPSAERLKHLHTLGLDTHADQAKIKNAWRRLAKRYHPDRLASQNLSTDELEQAEDLMQAINEAYDWLKEHS